MGQSEFCKSGTSIVRSSKPKHFSGGLSVLQSASRGGGESRKLPPRTSPLKPQKKMEKKHGCIRAQKRKEQKGFRGRCFPPGSGRGFAPAGILELRLPGSASGSTSDCECSQMDGSPNHLHRLFSYGGLGGGGPPPCLLQTCSTGPSPDGHVTRTSIGPGEVFRVACQVI